MTTTRSASLALLSGLSLAATLAACSSGTTDDAADAVPTPSPTVAEDTSDAASTPDPAAAEEAPDAAADSSALADGTYSATGSYQSPAGEETLGVSVTLAGGVISDVDIEVQATNPTSQKFQGKFASAIQEAVVGKPIDGLQLDAVAGASLTPEGFLDALDQISADARA